MTIEGTGTRPWSPTSADHREPKGKLGLNKECNDRMLGVYRMVLCASDRPKYQIYSKLAQTNSRRGKQDSGDT